MSNTPHIIRNFPKETPLWRRCLSNAMFLTSLTPVTLHESLLDPSDLEALEQIATPGDVLLVGQLKRLVKIVIHGPVTHSQLYIGKGQTIQATADGVATGTFKKIIKEYDTLAILRPSLPQPEEASHIIANTITYAQNQIGKPYNFFLEPGTDHFFCTQLINDAFHHAGFNTGLSNIYTVDSKLPILRHRPLYPRQFPYGNFDILYLSKHLIQDNTGKLRFNK